MKIIIALIVGVLLGMWAPQQFNPFARINEKRRQEKEVGKEQIASYLKKHTEATAEELMHALSIPKTTLHRYVDELQTDGSVSQVGSHHEPVYRLLR